ncbi:FAD-dependent monooxygenase [Fodinicola acaciae]|uniref:FAD-dependent monooxygenase n=1 Tax=Fodinicola acaciae TaxID=2681555 RepID=UPI0013D2411A|nr:FAD-dependent monooxygenase [Fodinicola acaciae]
MKNTTVLVSGASIAGPAIAFWLARYGCTVTVVEKAPQLRRGGQAVDFKSHTHRKVLERMGILDEILRRQTGGQSLTMIDADEKRLAVMPAEFISGEVEILRGDLSEILYDRTKDDCEYVFGDSITSLTETATGVQVTFEKSAPRTFDLVVGADGIHSNVRRLAFGPESSYVKFLGYYYALANLGIEGDGLMYNEPGRMVAIGGTKAPAFFVFGSPEVNYDRYDTDQQKAVLLRAYQGGRWRIPEMLAKVPASPDFYLDSLSQVRMDSYAKGRIVLLGDAGYGNTLGGFGSGLAIVGAYVLAGELAAAGGDHVAAFANYEEKFRRYAKVAKLGSAGPFLAPRSRLRIWLRNLTFRSKIMMAMMMKMTDDFASDIDLPEYPRPSLLAR